MFEILINGIPRNCRDREVMAIEAGRLLKARDKAADTRVVNFETRVWASIPDGAQRRVKILAPICGTLLRLAACIGRASTPSPRELVP